MPNSSEDRKNEEELKKEGISRQDYSAALQYNSKKGVGFGAWGGFIGAVAFTGIMLTIPLFLGLPTGSFLYAFGSNVLLGSTSDQSAIGLAAFSLVLAQGIIVGSIFGFITSKSERLHPSSKGKGVGMGAVAGVLAFLVLYLPLMIFVFPSWLSSAIGSLPETKLGLFGIPNYHLPSSTALQSNYFQTVLGVGLISYVVYGAIMGGIVTMSYSVFHFSKNRGIRYAIEQTSGSSSSAGAV